MGDLIINNSDDLKANLILYQGKIFGALAGGVTQDRMIGLAIRAVMTTPALLNCEPASILDSIAQAATLGVELDGTLGQAYLIPYKRDCKLVLGYRGMLDLARRHAGVKDITAEVVYAGDDFDYALGDDPFIRHKPSDELDRERQAITFVYVVANLTSGGRQRSVWSAAKINMHRDQYSKGADRNDSPWKTAWAQMSKKTVIRSMINSGAIPVSAEVQMLTGYEEYSEAGLGKVVTTKPRGDIAGLLDDTPEPNTDQAPGVRNITPDEDDLIGKTGDELLMSTIGQSLASCKDVNQCEHVLKSNEGKMHTSDAYDALCEMVEKRKAELRQGDSK